MNKTKRFKWSIEIAIQKILEVSLNISNGKEMLMPTKGQMNEYFGDSKLSTYLSHETKRTGLTYRDIANELGLKLQESTTELGNRYEIEIMKLLIKKGFEVSLTSSGEKYDLLVNGKKIDVKCAKAYFNRSARAHTFGINKIKPDADYYIVVALSEDGNSIEKILVIPSNKLQMKTLNIGANSKYDVYLDRYDLLV